FGCLLCIPYIASEVIVMNDIPVFGDTVSITDIQKYSVYFNAGILILVTLISFFIGWHMVMAIGGADMPVVVSMLNSYSGWATAASGFLLNNYAMIVGGALIGSSGAILSYIMCKAMNRSFMSVIFGGFGATPSKTRNQEDEGPKEINPIKTPELARLLMEAHNIAIVPGYGMAVAKAQHVVSELSNILIKAGKEVRF
ncbi:pyridine nucleotide transhydrogenase alpha subunit, putative, partial [Entamoeba nuttalli P19]